MSRLLCPPKPTCTHSNLEIIDILVMRVLALFSNGIHIINRLRNHSRLTRIYRSPDQDLPPCLVPHRSRGDVRCINICASVQRQYVSLTCILPFTSSDALPVHVAALGEFGTDYTVCQSIRGVQPVFFTLAWSVAALTCNDVANSLHGRRAIPLSFECVLLVLALYKAAEFWNLSQGLTGFHLVKVLVIDQAFYFAV